MPHGPAGTVTGFDRGLGRLHGDVRSGVTAITHEERGLPGWDQALGSVGPEGGTGRVEAEGAEAATTEETVIACHRSTTCLTLGQLAPSPLSSDFLAPVSDPRLGLDDVICPASRQGRFRKCRPSFFTGWSRLPLPPETRDAEWTIAKISADGTRAHS